MYKPIIALCLLFFFLATLPIDSQNALPDNDLWKEDKIDKTNTGQEMFNKVIDATYKIYKPLADANNESLVINKKWSDSTVNANVTRYWGTVYINMYGGLFRRPETTVEGFALVLCHEIGHAYGGTPYIRAYNKLSAEGQADYYGAKECLHQVLKELNLSEYELEPTYFMEDTCEKAYTGDRADSCVRSLIGGQSLGNLLATLRKVDQPSYQTPDPTVVEETLVSYPETVQCRLDTYLRGTLNQSRPNCWFKD